MCCCCRGLELLATVLLARNRQPPPTVTAGVPHVGFASELVSLPSGLLAMGCEAIVTLKVLLTVACVRACVRVCVRAFMLRGPSERADEVPARAHRLYE
jgi:hypothetical protein